MPLLNTPDKVPILYSNIFNNISLQVRSVEIGLNNEIDGAFICGFFNTILTINWYCPSGSTSKYDSYYVYTDSNFRDFDLAFYPDNLMSNHCSPWRISFTSVGSSLNSLNSTNPDRGNLWSLPELKSNFINNANLWTPSNLLGSFRSYIAGGKPVNPFYTVIRIFSRYAPLNSIFNRNSLYYIMYEPVYNPFYRGAMYLALNESYVKLAVSPFFPVKNQLFILWDFDRFLNIPKVKQGLSKTRSFKSLMNILLKNATRTNTDIKMFFSEKNLVANYSPFNDSQKWEDFFGRTLVGANGLFNNYPINLYPSTYQYNVDTIRSNPYFQDFGIGWAWDGEGKGLGYPGDLAIKCATESKVNFVTLYCLLKSLKYNGFDFDAYLNNRRYF